MDVDQSLVERARAGDEQAFADLVSRHQSRVFNLARALTASDADADDLSQEVFLRVYRGLASFRGDAAFSTWLYRVAVNVVRSHLARRSPLDWFRRRRAAEGEDEFDLDSLPAAGDAESGFLRRDAIDRALSRLPASLRVAVTLRDVEGLGYREIAEITGSPIGTVMSRIARGRARLRPHLRLLVERDAEK